MPPPSSERPRSTLLARAPTAQQAPARPGVGMPLTPKVSGKNTSATLGPTIASRRAAARLEPALNVRDHSSPGGGGSGNVTPRSGPRLTRAEHSGTGSPITDKSEWDSRHVVDGGGGVGGSGTHSGTHSGTNPGVDATRRLSAQSSPAAPQRPVSMLQRPATFFYANGGMVDDKRPLSMSTPASASGTTMPAQANSPNSASVKFFYADGTCDGPPLPSSKTSSPNSNSSNFSFSKNANASSSHKASTPPLSGRNHHPATASLGGSLLAKRKVSIDATRRPGFHSRSGSVESPSRLIASAGAGAASPPPQQPPTSHPSPLNSPPVTPGASGYSSNVASSQPLAMSMAGILQAAEEVGLEAPDVDKADDDNDKDMPPPPSSGDPTASPTISSLSQQRDVGTGSGGSGNDDAAELVANARRERKVQDLEIRNASLEAINRTLERQLRKQTTELRRYKRMSRSHISLVSGASSRVVSADMGLPPEPFSLSTMPQLVEEGAAGGGAATEGSVATTATFNPVIPGTVPGPGLGLGLGLEVGLVDVDAGLISSQYDSDLSESRARHKNNKDEDDNDDDDDDDDDMFDSLSESDETDDDDDDGQQLTLAELDAREIRRQKRDERRLHLDLSKHRQLLVDSQKMNQSLKRCLDWTEELIRDGQKALTYSVRVGDMGPGPRPFRREDGADQRYKAGCGDDFVWQQQQQQQQQLQGSTGDDEREEAERVPEEEQQDEEDGDKEEDDGKVGGHDDQDDGSDSNGDHDDDHDSNNDGDDVSDDDDEVLLRMVREEGGLMTVRSDRTDKVHDRDSGVDLPPDGG